MTVLENLDGLKEMGLIHLRMGYDTIYDKRKADNVRDVYSIRQQLLYCYLLTL